MRQRSMMPATLLMLALLAGCQADQAENRQPVKTVSDVRLVRVAQKSVTVFSEVAATVKAEDVAQLASRTTGLVRTVVVRAGDPVRAGQVLITIEAQDAAARAQAAANAVLSAQERLKLTDITWRRFQGLYARAAISRQEYDVAAANRQQAAAELARARAQAEEARLVRDFDRIRAPFDGRVTRRLVDPGSLAAPTQVLLEVEAAGQRHVEAAINETFSARLRLGQSIDLVLGERRLSGRILEINPAIDPATRTFSIKISLNQAPLVPASGQFARVYLPQSRKLALVVPEQSLVRRGQLWGVYVVDHSGSLRYRLVRPGLAVDGGREILSGLRPGERIAASGLERIEDGALIQADRRS